MNASLHRRTLLLSIAVLGTLPATAPAQYGVQHFGSKYSTSSYAPLPNPYSRGPTSGTISRPSVSSSFSGSPFAASTTTMPRTSYSDYYSQQLRNYRRPPQSARQYTIDNYFYQNPAVSPYSNLMRRGDSYVNNYYQYVLPEQQRRAAAGVR